MSQEARRSNLIPWKRSCRQVWSIICVLGTKSGPSERTSSKTIGISASGWLFWSFRVDFLVATVPRLQAQLVLTVVTWPDHSQSLYVHIVLPKSVSHFIYLFFTSLAENASVSLTHLTVLCLRIISCLPEVYIYEAWILDHRSGIWAFPNPFTD